MPVPGPPDIMLTQRQIDLLSLVAAGKTDAEIAALLNISGETVEDDMRQIFRKLDVNSRVTATVKGIMLGLIAP